MTKPPAVCLVLDVAGVSTADAGYGHKKNWVKDICSKDCPYNRCVFEVDAQELTIINQHNKYLSLHGNMVDFLEKRLTGRPKLDLPLEQIASYQSEGMSSRTIATKLGEECGIVVSYKTIQGILLGKRKKWKVKTTTQIEPLI